MKLGWVNSLGASPEFLTLAEALEKCNEIGDCAGVSKTSESGYALKGTKLERKLDGAHAWLKHYAISISKNTEVSLKIKLFMVKAFLFC